MQIQCKGVHISAAARQVSRSREVSWREEEAKVCSSACLDMLKSCLWWFTCTWVTLCSSCWILFDNTFHLNRSVSKCWRCFLSRWAAQACQVSLVLFLYLFLLDCVLSLLFPPVWFPVFHLCLFVFPVMMIKQELTSSICFKFHWEPSAVRQPYLISHLLLQIKIHVRVHKTWCFSFVMRIQLKSHQNESHPPLVFVKNLYCFLSGESQWFHLVHIAPFIFILLWHYVNSLKPTSHNLYIVEAALFVPTAAQNCSVWWVSALWTGKTQFLLEYWNLGRDCSCATLTAPPWRFATLK